MTAKPMDGYIRVSAKRGREGENYYTVDVQRDAITAWAAYKGETIGEWFIDEDWSGGTHERPGLEAAVERAVNGDSGGIVSWKIDRFSRYTEGGLRDLEQLESAGARLAFTVEDIDTSGPMGKFVYTIMLAMATYFLDNIKAGWREAKSRAIKRGAHIGPTPIGYVRTDRGMIEPHPVEAPIVVAAFQAAAAEGIDEALGLLTRGLPVRLTGKREGTARTWTPLTVRRLLASRVYLGEVRYGDLMSAEAHEPLVDIETWRNAQHPPTTTRGKAVPYPLSGFATCGTCGAHLVGSNGGPDGRRTYRCANTNGRKGERCDGPVSVSAEPLERHIVGQLREQWHAPLFEVGAVQGSDLGALQTALDEAAEELTAFASNTKVRRLLSETEWEHALEARVADRDEAQAALDAALNGQRPQRIRALTDEDWDTLGPVDLRDVVTGALSGVIVHKGRRAVADRVTLVQHGEDIYADDAEAAA